MDQRAAMADSDANDPETTLKVLLGAVSTRSDIRQENSHRKACEAFRWPNQYLEIGCVVELG